MVWFFKRHTQERAERMHYEVRSAVDRPGYELVVSRPDGSQRLVQFATASDLIDYSLDLQQRLLGEGWTSADPDPDNDWRLS